MTTKICPFRLSSLELGKPAACNCLERKCAWWIIDECAIRYLPLAIENLKEAVKPLFPAPEYIEAMFHFKEKDEQ